MRLAAGEAQNRVGTRALPQNMPPPPRKLLTALLFLLAVGQGGAGESPATSNTSLVGIDHVPTVVANLEEAVVSYQSLGFSIKPGRFHQNGLRNSHVKFPDGSGIELISPPAQPVDDLTETYAALLKRGEGPAYLSLHARDTDALTTALAEANIPFKDESGLITLPDHDLHFIFFVQDNRSPTDRPEHFAHPNTAAAMTEVWLALDPPARASLRTLLLALGAIESTETVRVPAAVRAEVFSVQNGRVVVVSDEYRLQNGREIIGVTFRVRTVQAVRQIPGVTGTSVPPTVAHGLWLRFEGPSATAD